tara:strand:- start:610 stop:783 length:174 start_codon:yes stop_codon:yes gene_type:complete
LAVVDLVVVMLVAVAVLEHIKKERHQFQDHHLQLSKLVEEVLEAEMLNISLQILTPE